MQLYLSMDQIQKNIENEDQEKYMGTEIIISRERKKKENLASKEKITVELQNGKN